MQFKQTGTETQWEALVSCPPEVFWLYGFEKAGEARYLEPEERIRLARKAHRCGVSFAKSIQKAYPGAAGERLLAKLGFSLCREDGGTAADSRLVFALFEPPKRICLRWPKEVKDIRWERELLHHELFHGLEFLNRDWIATRKKVEIKARNRQKRRRLEALSEIGAMAFAQEMGRLSWSPFLLDAILTKESFPSTHREILNILKHCHSIAVGMRTLYNNPEQKTEDKTGLREEM